MREHFNLCMNSVEACLSRMIMHDDHIILTFAKCCDLCGFTHTHTHTPHCLTFPRMFGMWIIPPFVCILHNYCKLIWLMHLHHILMLGSPFSPWQTLWISLYDHREWTFIIFFCEWPIIPCLWGLQLSTHDYWIKLACLPLLLVQLTVRSMGTCKTCLDHFQCLPLL